MRISDWSSDVCSSDLLGLPNLVSGSRFAAPEESEVYEFGLKGQWDVAAVNVAVFKQAIKGFQSNVFAGRSEEHTSELQSLMRISYAVFCLKKKNRKMKQKNTPTP